MSGTAQREGTRLFVLLCAAAFAVRLAIVATSIGTNDVIYKITWLRLAQHHGIARAYSFSPLLNHPPLSLALMLLESRLGALLHLEFTDVFRLVQVAADGLSAFALYRIGRFAGRPEARWLSLFFVLSPAAASISAFHCNTDPLMVALLLAAVALAIGDRPLPAAAGVVLAAAANIKILPFLAVPFFLVGMSGRRRIRFLLAFAATAALLLGPAVAIGGKPVLANIFGYSGMDQGWGFLRLGQLWRGSPSGLLRAIARLSLAIASVPRVSVVGSVLLLTFLGFRNRRSDASRTLPLALIGTLFLLLLSLEPSFAIQYLDWPIAFLPFALSRRFAVAMNAGISLFTFACYTVWSEGFPWWFADLRIPHPWLRELTIGSIFLWALLVAAAVTAVRRLALRSTG